MTAANLFGALLFGSIGLVAFLIGKKRSNFKAITIGILLMIYPYFVSNTAALYSIGIALTLGLFIFRR